MNSYEIAVNELRNMNEEWGHIWVLPPFEDCLKFAACEAAEVLDANLRMNPIYFRNRDFTQTEQEYYEEMGDTVMMLIKALISVDYPFDFHRDILHQSLVDSFNITGISIWSWISDNARGFPVNYSDIEATVCDLIASIDNLLGEGTVAKLICDKTDKMRAKIIAKLEEKARMAIESSDGDIHE